MNRYNIFLEEIDSLGITSNTVKKWHVFVIGPYMTGQRFTKIEDWLTFRSLSLLSKPKMCIPTKLKTFNIAEPLFCDPFILCAYVKVHRSIVKLIGVWSGDL